MREENRRRGCARGVGASAACLVLVSGCINVDTIHEYRGGRALDPPRRVVVKDFAYSPDDVSLATGLGAQVTSSADKAPKSLAELELGKRVADALSRKLVEKLLDLGLYAQRFDGTDPPFDNIVVIEGQFTSIDEGSMMKRMVVGFGFGKAEVRTHAQVYQVTEKKQRRILQDFITSATSSYSPGLAVGLGAGAAAGSLASAAVVGGSSTVANETWGSDVEAGAERTATELVAQMKPFFIDQAWIPAYDS